MTMVTRKVIAKLENRLPTWTDVWEDVEFAKLFVGNKVVRASDKAPNDAPYLEADVFWELEDGRWLAMRVELGSYSGCDTCGYDSGSKRYYVLEW